MSFKIIFVPLLSGLFLTACQFIPQEVTPALPVKNEWQAEGVQTTDNVSSVAWRDFFTSPVLQNMIMVALENNRDLRTASLRIDEARATYRIQKSNSLPSVDGTTSVLRQNIPDNASLTGNAQTLSQYNVGVGITAFELDFFGKVQSQNKAILEQYFATQEARNIVQIALISEISNRYLNYLANKKQLELTQNVLQTQGQALHIIQKNFEMGVGSELDVAQASILIETARANEAFYTRLIAQDKNALALLMGQNITEDILGRETLEEIHLLENIPVGLPSDVLLKRPDVKQAEYLLKSANATIGVARAAFFPNISLTGNLGFASNNLSNLVSSASGVAWNFIPQITVPIFNHERNEAGLDVAKIRKNIAIVNYEKTIQTAFREVSDELAGRETYDKQLKAQEALIGSSQKSYSLTKARYDYGVDNYLDVLNTQLALYNAQQNKIIIQQQRLSNVVTLYKVLGGGLY